MGKSKLKIALGLCIPLIFTVFVGREVLIIGSTLKSIGKYRDMYDSTYVVTSFRLARLEQEAGELRAGEALVAETSGTAEGHALSVRNLLYAQGIKPEQFRITGSGKDTAVEFVINCPPIPFFNVLLELSKNNISALNYISVKPDTVTGNIKSTLRFAGKAEILPVHGDKPEPAIQPRLLAASFRIPGIVKVPPQENIPGSFQNEKRTAPMEKSNYKYLGSIKKDNDGLERIYIKDMDTGIITAVSGAIPVSVNENSYPDDTAYLVEIGGSEFIIRRN
jgi:hypothetical protein